MKISLAWLFDHIEGDWHKVDVPTLVSLFNLKVAEIESFEQIALNHQDFTVAKLEQIGPKIQLFSPELDQKIELPIRNDLVIGKYYFLSKRTSEWAWASGQDFNSAKEVLFPALYFENDQAAAKWHERVKLHDYILEVDNKSLTNRPDMWGHRGFAREIAALLGLNLLPESQFLAQVPVQEFAASFGGDCQNSFKTAIESSNCKRLATLYINSTLNVPSQLWVAIRLFLVDMRGINNLVDLTNYVMLDLGQPMHVFDANALAQQTLVARQAQGGEKLALLTGETLELINTDLIIADGEKPVSLAGIKGGADSGTNVKTSAILLEAACFDATTIRHSSARYKIRTEASARFEKTLDPMQNVLALERFVKLQQMVDPNLVIKNAIISLGAVPAVKQIDFTHEFVEKRLGVKIEPQFIVNILEKLGFELQIKAGKYMVTVPSWRASKDVNIAEDLLEEVARMWGYDKITPILPSKITLPGNLGQVLRLRQIKQFLSSAAGMHEVENYPFYDETFLQEIKWQPLQTVEVKNPVSENWRRLVTSLIPHLCKNVQQNSHDLAQLRYFEWGRIWYPKDANSALESRILAGIFYKRASVDFYEMKSYLQAMFDGLGLTIVWQKPSETLPVWWHPYQTAILVHDQKQIGIAGKLGQGWLNEIAEGQAFGFELDGDFLLNQPAQIVKYQPLSRYQPICLDISLFAPLALTVATLEAQIKQADTKIYQVELIDSFKKDDWLDQKALTFRYYFVDQEKTLSGEEIATVQQAVEAVIQKNGASVR